MPEIIDSLIENKHKHVEKTGKVYTKKELAAKERERRAEERRIKKDAKIAEERRIINERKQKRKDREQEKADKALAEKERKYAERQEEFSAKRKDRRIEDDGPRELVYVHPVPIEQRQQFWNHKINPITGHHIQIASPYDSPSTKNIVTGVESGAKCNGAKLY